MTQPATRPGLLLGILLAGQFMAILDVAVVNVAAATVRTDLSATGAQVQLVVAGYTIAYAVALITGARLGDRLGPGAVFQAGLALFTVASLACGLAWSTGALIGLRFAQGVGAALLMPQVLSLIQRHFSGADRIRALGRYAAVIAGASVVGQVVGGLLVSADLWGTGWRPVFLVNVPVGVGLLVLARRHLPRERGDRSRGLDPGGLVTLSLAVLLLVVPLVLGHEEHWPLWGWLALAASVPAFAAFVAVERRARAPLVPMAVLAAPGIGVALVALFLTMSAYGGFLFTTALHLQGGLGYPAARAGATFVVAAVCFGTASLNWRRLPARWYPALPSAGLAVGALGLVGTALGVRDGTGLGAAFWLGQVAFGLGFGCAFAPLMTRALARVPVPRAADASGLLTTMTQLAQVIGVASFGTGYLAGHPSGPALAVVAAVEGLAALLAAAVLLPLRRRYSVGISPAGPMAASDGGRDRISAATARTSSTLTASTAASSASTDSSSS
jgi:MFS family permease